jgi:predicted MFS family arabinose efflux permease
MKVSILNGASFFGRLFSGFVARKFGLFPSMVFFITSSAIIIFCLAAVHNLAGAAIFTILIGFTTGAGMASKVPDLYNFLTAR